MEQSNQSRVHIWLRAEPITSSPSRGDILQSETDKRAPLVPQDAKRLVDQGFLVTVEHSDHRVFPDEEYKDAGCKLVPFGSWTEAPQDAYVLGIRGFPTQQTLCHRHIYFGHAFKYQPDWHAKLVPFLRGGGVLYDLEYLTDSEGKRLTSYGPVAGMIGMAAGVLAWCTQAMASVGVTIPNDLLLKLQSMGLVEHLKSLLQMAVTFAHRTPRVVVIGPKGKVGAKAVSMAESLGLQVDGWGRDATAKKGPYPELLKYHILVNAIKLDTEQEQAVGPFLTHELIRQSGRELSVVVDISCDTLNPLNPLPIYSQPTTFTHPTVRVIEQSGGVNPLDLIAIPTLPSLVPAISSQDFSAQLLPHLLDLSNPKNEVWQRAEAIFRERTRALRPVPVPRSVLFAKQEEHAEAAPLLSFSQERVWRLMESYARQIKIDSEEEKKERERKSREEGERLSEGEAATYNVARAFAVKGNIEQLRANLHRHVEAIVAHHEVLRTAFFTVESVNKEEAAPEKKKEEKKGEEDCCDEEHDAPKVAPVRVGLVIKDAKDVDVKAVYRIIEESADVESVYNSELATPFNHHSNSAPFVPLLSVVLLVNKATLLVTSNRLVADEWSLHLLAEELVHGCTNASSLQYLDFAHWQRTLDRENEAILQQESDHDQNPFVRKKKAESSALKELTYWNAKLSGSPPVLQMPIDKQRQPLQSFRCSTETRVLPKELSEGVKKVALRLAGLEVLGDWVSKDDVSSALYTMYLSLYKLILFRLTGEEDSVLAATVSGRLRREVFHTVGPFTNSLILRSHVHDQLTFEELYKATNQMLQEALRNQGTPFEKIVSELNRPGSGEDLSLKHAPLFQVCFEFDDQVLPPTSAPAGEVSLNGEIPLPKKLAPHDFVLHVSPNLDSDKGVELKVVYNSDLLEKERIDETLSQMELLLSSVLADTKQRIVQYSLITERARKLIPDPLTPLDSSWLGPIHEMLTKQATAHPDRQAIYYDGKTMNYGWLEAKTNQLADCLIQSGIKKGDVIAIYGHRSPAVVFAILGILKSGAAYSMMDPKYPASRIIDCLTVANINGWIQIADAGELPAPLVEYLSTLTLRCQLEVANVFSNEDNKTVKHPHIFGGQFKSTPPDNVKIDGEDIAVVTFTSGSTGMPKGVQGRHLPLTHFYPWMHERFGIGPEDKFSMCSGIAHDPLQRDIFTPVFFGASIYIPTEETIVTPGKLGEWMSLVGINVACLTPAMGQLLTTLDNPNFSITTLKGVFFVGDLLIKRDVFRLKKLAPNSFIINMYGSTETQRAVGYWEVPPLEVVHGLRQVMPVGVGMKDVDMLLLNSAGLQAGVGEVAEIYVRSPHLARGYLGLEEETQKKFILNPFTAHLHGKTPGAADRLYRTGDLGRYMPDGLAECIGRADDQVKIRGFRIELGEINAQLSQHKCVKENVTVVKEDKVGQKRLVSYVVPTEFDDDGKPVLSKDVDTEMFAQHCREFLKKKLPQYMVPTKIVVLQSMPLTPNGKINKPALPDPFVAPTTAVPPSRVKILSSSQQDLVNVWSKLLGVNTVNIDDDFFEDLGGHSLLATQAVFQMSETFHINLPINLLFGSPNIEAIAAYIDRVKSGNSAAQPKSEFSDRDTIDLLKEAQSLDASIALPKSEKLVESAISSVFLTGSTGFLGSFLLRDLLELSKATVYCHLRAPSVESGKERLKQSLNAHGLWKEEYAQRLVPVPGDLAQPLLGIDSADFERLAQTVDVIVHNGAFVHWLKPYKALKAANVLGTQETLRLAVTGKVKRVHYISTTSVYDTEYHSSLKTVLESDNLPEYKGIVGGYPQSKWVADKMMIIAREERNIPVSIYRPGYITGDTVNGLWNTDDYLCRFIKGCIQLEAAPIIDPSMGLDMSPVDYVSKAVVAILLANHNDLEKLQKNHNVINPSLTTYQSLFESILSFGYPLKLVKYSEWRKLLIDSAAAQKENALNALLGHFSESWEEQLKNSKYDNANVVKALEGADVTCPAIDSPLVARYFTYLIGCGFIHPPPRTPNNDLAIDWEKIKEGVSLLSRTNRS